MMPKISKKMTGHIAVVAALLGFLWWYSRPVAVTVAQAEYGSAALYVYASGQVVPDEKVIVRSKNTARIALVLVKEGDEVTAGMTLVELAGDEVRADLAAAQASLDNARSEYEYRRLEYNRLSKLVNENAIPRRDFDQAATELSQAEGSYQKAQSQVAALVSRSSEYVLTSPFAGVVLERRKGAIVTLPAAAFAPATPPSDAEITAWYNGRKADYALPERRTIRYVTFGDSVLKTVPAPSDAEIAARYNANKAKYAPSDKRKLSQLVLPTEAAAKALVAEVSGGKSLEAAAQSKGLSVASLGSLDKAAFALQSSSDAANAAFSTSTGKVAGPFKSPLG